MTQTSKQAINIVSAQVNLLVGDIEANSKRVIDVAQHAAKHMAADVVVFPELTLTSYPPEDLLLRPALYRRLKEALLDIQQSLANDSVAVVIGFPAKEEIVKHTEIDTVKEVRIYNRLAWIEKGEIRATYNKQKLPNYDVFDEKRYFTASKNTEPCIIDCKGHRLALVICEDLWHKSPAADAARAGADCIISINASPFNCQKATTREMTIAARAQENNIPILYVNLIGGQDDLLFDGGSFAINPQQQTTEEETAEAHTPIWHGDFFVESIAAVQFHEGAFNSPKEFNTPGESNAAEKSNTAEESNAAGKKELPNPAFQYPSLEARVYDALVLGARDYLQKNNFPGALLGLSGGIDSALALAIIVDAIGSENVQAVMMPSRFTRDMSIEDAKECAKNLQVQYLQIDIEKVFCSFVNSLQDHIKNGGSDCTEENIQARCRGTMLMALSNKNGRLVIACGNKSEMAVGYATLYGDMVGGFAVIKDIPKMMVYRLARYRNHISQVIPQRIIDRPPSAELSAEQVDTDSLPDYPILDDILKRYIELDQSPEEIIKAGFEPEVVKKIVRLVNHNEYKRRQAPPGVIITARSFDKGRRYPITSGYFKD